MQNMWIPKLSAAAFMVGLGAAVFNGAAVAAAAPADSDSTSTSASSSSSAPAGDAKEQDSQSKTTKEEDDAQETDAATDSPADTSDTSEDAPEDDSPSAEQPDPSETQQTSDSDPATEPASTPQREESEESGDSASDIADSDASSIDEEAEPFADTSSAALLTQDTTPHAEPAASEVSATAAEATLAVPAPPSLAAMLDALRFWLSQTLISQAPTASPRWLSQNEYGQITGSLDPRDPAGHPLKYTVTDQPTNGTVTVNPDGTFEYTPDAATVAAGGLDSFDVDVSNGVRSLFVIDGTGVRLNWFEESTITVPVNLIMRPDNALGIVTNVNRFWVINTSSKRLRWNGYVENDGATGPSPDVWIDPGQEVSFDLASSIGTRKSFVTTYSVDGNWGQPDYGIYATQSGIGQQDGNCWGGSCYVNNGWAFFLQDDPNTTVTIDATNDPYGAREKLLSLCQEGSRAQCDFTPSRQEKTSGNEFELTVLRNGGGTTITQEISESRTATETDSVEISSEASSKLSDLVNLKIAAKYGHSWTKSATISYKLTVPVAAQSSVRVYAANPVDRVWGDFTIKMGNTTYYVNNIAFDTPDATRVPSFRIAPITTIEEEPAVAV